MLTVAVSKGRIYDEAMPLLERAGMSPLEGAADSRRLLIDTVDAGLRLVIIRAQDVPTFVEHGAADLGIAGKDVLLEHGGESVYEPLDLQIARCKLVLAGPQGGARASAASRLRVATKYPATTRRYFAERGKQVEIIKLYGSMELAPLVGLAECIVDLMDTGNTLRANDLKPIEDIAEISSRLIVNKAAMKLEHDAVVQIIERLRSAVEREGSIPCEGQATQNNGAVSSE